MLWSTDILLTNILVYFILSEIIYYTVSKWAHLPLFVLYLCFVFVLYNFLASEISWYQNLNKSEALSEPNFLKRSHKSKKRRKKKRWQWYYLAVKFYNFETGQILRFMLNWLQICTHVVKNNDMTVALLKTQLLSSNNNRFWWNWYIRFSINYTTGQIASSWQLLKLWQCEDQQRVNQLPG